jgi:hypothetical protein
MTMLFVVADGCYSGNMKKGDHFGGLGIDER